MGHDPGAEAIQYPRADVSPALRGTPGPLEISPYRGALLPGVISLASVGLEKYRFPAVDSLLSSSSFI